MMWCGERWRVKGVCCALRLLDCVWPGGQLSGCASQSGLSLSFPFGDPTSGPLILNDDSSCTCCREA